MKALSLIILVSLLCIVPEQLSAQTPIGVATPSDQEACTSVSIVEIVLSTSNGMDATTTYAWTRDNTVNVTHGATSGTGNIQDALFNNTNTPQVVTYTIIPTSVPGGAGAPFFATVTVNPYSLVHPIADIVVCNTDPVVANFTTSNIGGTTTYSWVNDTPGIGLAGSGSGDILFNAVNTGTSPIVANISVTPYFSNGGIICDGPPELFTITVNPAAQVNDPADQELCNLENTALVSFTTTTSPGSSTYTWTNDNTSIGLASSGTGDISSFTAQNFGVVPEIATITVTPQYSYDGVSCDGPSETFTITVYPEAQVDDPVDQVICYGEPIFVHFTTNRTGGTASYTWVNDNTDIGLPAGGTGDIFGVAMNAINEPIVANITVTPHFNIAGITCDGPPEVFTITVNPEARVNLPVSQIVCNTESTTAVIFSTDRIGGTTSYAWTNDDTSIGLAASGTGDIPSFAAINTGTSPVVATITVSPSFTDGGPTCFGPPEVFTITVNPTAQVYDPVDLVVCNTETTPTVLFTTNRSVGVTTFTWTNNNSAIGLASSGIGDIPSFSAVNPGTAPIISNITVTPHFTYGGHICDGPPEVFTITVNPTAQVHDPPDQLLCNTENTNTVTFATDRTIGVTSYTWTNDSPSIGLAASGSGDIPSFAALNFGTAPVIATITVTPLFTYDGHACSGPVEEFTVTVNPSAQVNDPADQVVCNTDVSSASFTTTNTGGTTIFNWVNDTPVIGLSASGSGDFSFSAINSGIAPVVATVTVTPQYTSGGLSCDGPSQQFTITVNPTAQVNDPADLVVCNTENTLPITFTSNRTTGTTTYTWINDMPSIGLAASGTGNIPAFAAVNAGLGPVIATITVTPHFEYGGQICDGPSETFSIMVNPSAQVYDPIDQLLCNADATTVNFTTNNIGGTTSYTWVNDTPGIGLAASGSGNIAFTAVNAGTSPLVATITVTPHFTNSSAICDGPVQQFTITVNPIAQVNDPADQSVFNGGNTTAVTFTTNRSGGTTSYTWTNDTPSIGLAAAGSGDIPAFTAVNSTMAPVTATITVTPQFTFGGLSCDGPSESFTITVDDGVPVTNAGLDQEICASLSTTLTANDPMGGTGLWSQVSGPGTILFGDAGVYNTSASSTIYGTYVLRWSVTYGGSTSTDDVTIIFNEDPVQAAAGSDQDICGTLSTTLEGIAHVYQGGTAPAGSTRQWTYVSGPDSSPVFGDATSPSSTLTVSTSGSYVFRWTEINGNCVRSDDVSIDLSDTPNVSGGPDQEVCYGESVTLTGTGDGTISWDQGVVNGTPFIPTQTGEYHVSVLNGSGCSNSDTVVVVVNPLPDADAGPDQEVCFGEAVTLTATGGTHYLWDNSVSNGVPFTPSATTVYNVVVSDDKGCSDQDQVLVEVNPIPPTPIITYESDTLFSDSDMGNQWYVDGTPITDAEESFYVPKLQGTYHAVVTQGGCESEESNKIFVVYSGVGKNDVGELKIYPNPTEDFIKIETDNIGQYNLMITSSTGQLILKEDVSDPLHRVDLSSMHPGIYFITISAEELVSTRKVIKR